MYCNHNCKWYPKESFNINSSDDYKTDKNGVKRLKKRKHLCILTDEEINHEKECREYKNRTDMQIT
jgi:hypothetical protein